MRKYWCWIPDAMEEKDAEQVEEYGPDTAAESFAHDYDGGSGEAFPTARTVKVRNEDGAVFTYSVEFEWEPRYTAYEEEEEPT